MGDITVSYEGDLRCRAEHAETGIVVLTDAPADNHGQGEGFSPSDLLSVSLGSCILSIMGIAAQAMDVDIGGATATITKEMANAPRRISRIAVALHVPGDLMRASAPGWRRRRTPAPCTRSWRSTRRSRSTGWDRVARSAIRRAHPRACSNNQRCYPK